MKTFCLEFILKEGVRDVCGRKYSHKELPKTELFGQVWGNSGKNLSHPKKLPAPACPKMTTFQF